MSGEDRRLDAAGADGAEPGEGGGEQGRLGDVGASEEGVVARGADAGEVEPEYLARSVEEVSGGGLAFDELGGHTGPLGGLAGEEKGDSPSARSYHRRIRLPQLSPAPKLDRRMRSPELTRRWRTVSSRARGMEAAEVLP